MYRYGILLCLISLDGAVGISNRGRFLPQLANALGGAVGGMSTGNPMSGIANTAMGGLAQTPFGGVANTAMGALGGSLTGGDPMAQALAMGNSIMTGSTPKQAPPPAFNPSESTKRYLMHFGNTPAPPPVGGDVNLQVATPEDIEAVQEETGPAPEPDTSMSPEEAMELKKVIAMEQNTILKLQAELNEVMATLQKQETRAQAETAAAASNAVKNGIRVELLFPQENDTIKETTAEEVAGVPVPRAPKLQANGDIPQMLFRADSKNNLQSTMERLMKQQDAAAAARTVENHSVQDSGPDMPDPLITINKNIAKIGKLQAQKARLEAKQAEEAQDMMRAH